MKLRIALLSSIFLFFCMTNVFAEDLKIEDGKTLLFDFVNYNGTEKIVDKDNVTDKDFVKTDPGAIWYDRDVVYDNVNIGAGSRVILDSAWEYVFVSSNTCVEEKQKEPVTEYQTDDYGEIISSHTYIPTDEIHKTTFTYSKRERLVTLSLNNNGTITLNNGSELSIRNEYSLITSSGDISLKYKSAEDSNGNECFVVDSGYITTNEALKYISRDEDGELSIDGTSANMKIAGEQYENLFTGDIIFERGDSDTILTFRGVSKKNVTDKLGDKVPAGTQDWPGGKTSSKGDILYQHIIETEKEKQPTDSCDDIITMTNNFIINANRAVFNVETDWKHEEGSAWSQTDGGVVLQNSNTDESSNISGNGMIVKKGVGVLNLTKANAMALTGSSTGYGWRIEEGMVTAGAQENLGEADIYIDENGTLGLYSNMYGNNMTLNGGGISIASRSGVVLTGKLSGEQAHFTLFKDSYLMLANADNVKNDIENYVITFGGDSGGYNNYLFTDVNGLARNLILAENITDEKYKETAFFQLVLEEDTDTEYSGSLQGEMYLQKKGSGIVTLSGENTYTQGTYITQGGLLLATANSIGTGKILFDGGTRGISSTYATLGVSDDVENVNLTNDIHIKNGAILNVAENQTFNLSGSIENYDARPGFETEIVKRGLGNVVIASNEDTNRKINITTFTVNEGRFTLDKGVVLDSYFSLDGTTALLEMKQNSGVTNNIDILNGSLMIFNEENISSSTVNFKNDSLSDMSKFYISSNTVLTSDKFGTNKIHIQRGIEFSVLDGTTTANVDVLDFKAGNNAVIHKSGKGVFELDAKGNNFGLSNLEVTDGNFKIKNSTITVSGDTILDGGILTITEGSYYKSSAANKKITILDGAGVGIYDDHSISGDVLLSFEGTDEDNLSQLVVEADDVKLKNSIYVEKGLIIANEGTLSFNGDSITGNMGIFGKSGSGEMTIATSGGFEMGELRILDGTMQLNTNVDVSTLTIKGKDTVVNISSTTNITVKANDYFSISSSTLNMTENTSLNLKDADISNAKLNFTLSNVKTNLVEMNNTTLNLTTTTFNAAGMDITDSVINMYDSKLTLKANAAPISGISMAPSQEIMNIMNTTLYIDTTSVIKASKINISSSSISGSGKFDGNVTLSNKTTMTIGKENEFAKIETGSITFDENTALFIDVSRTNQEEKQFDVLKVNGDLDVKKNVTLNVNVMGDYDTDYNSANSFAFIEYSGNLSYFDSVYNMFDINLSNKRFSSNLFLSNGNSIVLQLSKEWDIYNMPGVTKNQQEMEDVLNAIYEDLVTRETFKTTLETLDSLYGDYRDDGNAAPFLKALRELSGINYINSIMSSTLLSKTNMIYTRLNEYSQRQQQYNIWAQAYTNSLSVGEEEENPKYDNSVYGLIAGFDQQLDENSVVGVSGFYGTGEFKQVDDKSDVSDGGINLYGSYEYEKFGFKGTVGYASQNYDTTRKLSFVGGEIKSNYSVNVYSIDAQADYNYELNDNFMLKPFIGLACNVAQNGDIREKGIQQQRLLIKENTYTKADLRIGVGIQSNKEEAKFNWYASLLAKQILTGNQFKMKASFIAVPDEEFEIESTKLNSTAFAGNLGCMYGITEAINVFADLSMDTSSNTSSFNGNIGASYRW